jgi:hypothetical protein
MLFGETVAVYCENHTEHINMVYTVISSCKCAINPITNPNPVCGHLTRDSNLKLFVVKLTVFYTPTVVNRFW